MESYVRDTITCLKEIRVEDMSSCYHSKETSYLPVVTSYFPEGNQADDVSGSHHTYTPTGHHTYGSCV